MRALVPLTLPTAGADADDTLEAVLAWITERGLSPYPAQEEAILELFAGNHVILATPTGSGKSLVAVACHALHLAAGRRSVYTAPIKALVSEKFFALCEVFGSDNVGMMTGDGSVNASAPVICCTAEVLEKMALREGADTPFAAVIMDEFHYYGDRDRGMAWQVPLLTMPRAQFLLMSATLGPTHHLEQRIEEQTSRPVRTIKGTERPVPLTWRYSEDTILESLTDLVQTGKSPVYAVHFSQGEATRRAQALLSTNFLDKDKKQAISDQLRGVRFNSPFGKTIRRMVTHGVGLHHAGLLPRYRLLVEKLAQQGLFVIICGTDTLGVGINVPIRTVLFTQLCKFDGSGVDILKVRDFLQIAGRAGRKGFDEEGLVVVQAPEWVVENKRLEASGKSKKRKSQAPTKGYKHWDQTTFEQLTTRPPEELEPVFTMDHSVVLARLQRAQDLGTDPMDELDQLIEVAHTGVNESERLRQEARERVAQLVQSGIVEEVNTKDGVRYEVYDDLQDDFSLHHALSLFLVHLVELLDAEHPEYPLRVLTCVESILEHPKVVLSAQLRRDRGKRIGELKADGVPYEERMEAVEDVTWPKPHADWLYTTFDAFRAKRPWLDGDPVRPKSVVREMVERLVDFESYVIELELARSEGVLLRYISQVYKTLVQGVPEHARTDGVYEVIGHLRAMLARVDDSLLATWESLRQPDAEAAVVSERPADLSENLPAFRARIRAELHAVVRALAAEQPDEAEDCVRQRPERPFTAMDFALALDAFHEAHGPVAWDGRARQAFHTTIEPDGPHRWRVGQRLLAAGPEHLLDDHLDQDEDEVAWFIEGLVDLSDDTCPSGPIIEVLAIREL